MKSCRQALPSKVNMAYGILWLKAHFYVGTVHQHPHTWIIVGLFYPLKQKES
jgi:hypothetical protein